MSSFKDLSGMKFGKLTVVKKAERTVTKNTYWLCVCSCGGSKEVTTGNLNSGNTASCGCLWNEKVVKHRLSNTSIYHAWEQMIARCNNPKHRSYKNYGGRGVYVCDRWLSFTKFHEDMGEKPDDKHSIERIKNDLGYFPGNCKWATRTEQQRNKRNNKVITFKNESKVLQDWATHLGINISSLRYRFKKGWSVELAFTKPVRPKIRRSHELI